MRVWCTVCVHVCVRAHVLRSCVFEQTVHCSAVHCVSGALTVCVGPCKRPGFVLGSSYWDLCVGIFILGSLYWDLCIGKALLLSTAVCG